MSTIMLFSPPRGIFLPHEEIQDLEPAFTNGTDSLPEVADVQ